MHICVSMRSSCSKGVRFSILEFSLQMRFSGACTESIDRFIDRHLVVVGLYSVGGSFINMLTFTLKSIILVLSNIQLQDCT